MQVSAGVHFSAFVPSNKYILQHSLMMAASSLILTIQHVCSRTECILVRNLRSLSSELGSQPDRANNHRVLSVVTGNCVGELKRWHTFFVLYLTRQMDDLQLYNFDTPFSILNFTLSLTHLTLITSKKNLFSVIVRNSRFLEQKLIYFINSVVSRDTFCPAFGTVIRVEAILPKFP